MMRMRVWIAAALLLVLSLAGCAVIAQPPASTPSIAGTTWEGTDVEGDHYVYRFQEDGTLEYTTPDGTWTNGTWRQDGDEVYMETNNRYAERVGRIKGSQMSGRAWNVAGLKWTWNARRQEQ